MDTDLRTALAHMSNRLQELETAARKLPNQTFADVTKAAAARITQLCEHPDLDAVAAQLQTDTATAQTQIDAGTATGSKPEPNTPRKGK